METLFIGQNHIHLNEVDSTNSYAIALLKNVNLTEGSLITCDNQTQGRGQRGSLWEAQAGQNATFSLVLKPTFLSQEKLFYLSKCSALAVYDVLTQVLVSGHFDIKIKWPNDILVDKKKISGMLIENNFSNQQLLWSVLGVGLNTNQITFSEGINATSLKNLTLTKHDTLGITKAFCTAFEGYYLQLKNKSFKQIDVLYYQRLFGLNEWIDVEIDGKVERLFFETVTESGRIELYNEAGKSQLFDVKQVKWLSSNFNAKS